MVRLVCHEDTVNGKGTGSYFCYAVVDGVSPDCVAYSCFLPDKEEAKRITLKKLMILKEELADYHVEALDTDWVYTPGIDDSDEYKCKGIRTLIGSGGGYS